MLASWWGGIAAYGLNIWALLTGQGSIYGVIALCGLAALVAGAALAVRQKVPQAWRMLAVGLLASLAPIPVGIAQSILGWLGMLFAVLGGFIIMLVGTWTVSIIADRRLPVWLLGLFATALMIVAAESAGAFISLSA